MTHNDPGRLPLGARVLPGVDLRLWVLTFAAVALSGLVTVLAFLTVDR